MPSKTDLGFGVSVEGFDEMQGTLNRFSTNGADRAIRKAIRAGAAVMQAAIQENAPERTDKTGSGLPVGALKRDINLSQVKTDPGKQHYEISVGPGKATAHTAMWVEYGHAAPSGSTALIGQRVKVSGHGRPTPAHPFLRPAWEATQEQAGQVIQDVLEAEMEKAIDGNGDVPNAGGAEAA